MFAAETYAGGCRSASVAEKSPRPCHHGYDHPEKGRLTAPDVRPGDVPLDVEKREAGVTD